MNETEAKRRIENRMTQDYMYAANVRSAVAANNQNWLKKLFVEVLGIFAQKLISKLIDSFLAGL